MFFLVDLPHLESYGPEPHASKIHPIPISRLSSLVHDHPNYFRSYRSSEHHVHGTGDTPSRRSLANHESKSLGDCSSRLIYNTGTRRKSRLVPICRIFPCLRISIRSIPPHPFEPSLSISSTLIDEMHSTTEYCVALIRIRIFVSVYLHRWTRTSRRHGAAEYVVQVCSESKYKRECKLEEEEAGARGGDTSFCWWPKGRPAEHAFHDERREADITNIFAGVRVSRPCMSGVYGPRNISA